MVCEPQIDQVADYARRDGNLAAGNIKLLLDGQHNILSLYHIVSGRAPKCFDTNTRAFTGRYFNLEDERKLHV
ncbi:MAG: hypothetical protein AAFW95_15745 [Cyanobacteria bacterium J06638_6]